MNKVIFSTILLGASTLCFGQIWDYVVGSTANTQYYLDRTSIRPSGPYISYTQLSNFQEERKYNNMNLRSMVQSRLADCGANKFKTIGMIGYSEFDAKGVILVVSSNPDREWVVINMDKITGDIQREVCR